MILILLAYMKFYFTIIRNEKKNFYLLLTSQYRL